MVDSNKVLIVANDIRSNYKGNFYLLISQLTFLICGYGIQIIISKMLTPNSFGLWGIVTSVLIWFELVVISGFPKAVTKYISESNINLQNEIYQKSFLIQMIAGLSLGGLFLLLAKPMSIFWGDQRLVLLLQISACDILFYGLYFENMAILNGMHKYKKMLWLQMSYSFSKVLFVFIFMYYGFGLTGAAWGNIIASVFVYIVSQIIVGFPLKKNSSKFSVFMLIKFAIPNTIIIIIFALIQRLDFFFLKSITKFTDTLGYYWAAVVLAKTPFFLIESTTKKTFAVICELNGKNETERIQIEIKNEYYFMFFLLFFILSVTIGGAESLLSLLFPAAYISASSQLKILIIAYCLNSIMFFNIQVLLALEQLKSVLKLIMVSLFFGILFCYFLIESYQVIGAAYAALTTSGFAFLITSVVLKQKIKLQIFEIKKYWKSILAGLLTVLVGTGWEINRVFILDFFKLSFLSLFYMLILYLLKEPIVFKAIGLMKEKLKNI